MATTSTPVSNASEETKPEYHRLPSKFSLTPGRENAPLLSPMIERPDRPLFPADVGFQGRRFSNYSPSSSSGGSTDSCGSTDGVTEISMLPSMPYTEESSLSSHAPTPSVSTKNFISSPLNPTTFHSFARSHTLSELNRIPSEDIRAICNPSNTSLRSSMILYRLADEAPPTRRFHPHRKSILSTSGDSVLSLSSDSKYPSAPAGARDRGLVAYAFDPLAEDLIVDDEKDETLNDAKMDRLSPRGMANVAALICLLLAIISLFVVYPVVSFYKHSHKNRIIAENPFINSTGQAEDTIPTSRHGVRSQSPFSHEIPLGHGMADYPGEYTLIFKDEFDRDNRPLINGNDPVWQATVYAKTFFARIYKNHLVLDGSAGAVRLHRPVCIKPGGYLEISYRSPDDREIKKFAWYAESEVASWLGLTIDLGESHRY
ncbi:uncharacterized protein EV420DRAFT_312951 [Desarmillaria tabescens]|uniref:Uncharacterized protein n=1 Tax=Armillaria tabescens TaxID=1929756 RepID=A0AA39N6J4_ARMTA|nr:uncharacterized protein EV420DRAFT_312951 [Desarmillaria tabescens]KAK0459274.1 hypothetical protein EV420DRAFT_312951 [Desarmillaria tabescens]